LAILRSIAEAIPLTGRVLIDQRGASGVVVDERGQVRPAVGRSGV